MTFTDTGGPTIATLVMVPMTSAAWAGAVGLAMVGAFAAKRRRGIAG
jgi:MYXO-CTERM domain-containing protein